MPTLYNTVSSIYSRKSVCNPLSGLLQQDRHIQYHPLSYYTVLGLEKVIDSATKYSITYPSLFCQVPCHNHIHASICFWFSSCTVAPYTVLYILNSFLILSFVDITQHKDTPHSQFYTSFWCVIFINVLDYLTAFLRFVWFKCARNVSKVTESCTYCIASLPAWSALFFYVTAASKVLSLPSPIVISRWFVIISDVTGDSKLQLNNFILLWVYLVCFYGGWKVLDFYLKTITWS